MKSKSNQPESTRAIPEELRLKLLPWVDNFKRNLNKLKSVRENSSLGSREYNKLKAEIETKWELPYLPDPVVDGAPFGDPDILPFCTPVRIKTQRIVDGKKDPRKGFFCYDCQHSFRKLVTTGEGYYCYNCGRMAKNVMQKTAGILHHDCGFRLAKVKKGELRVAGGRAKCSKCGSKKTILQERLVERIVEVKDNVLLLEVDTRFSSPRILKEIDARLSALEVLGQITPNTARKRSDKYLDYYNSYFLYDKQQPLGQIAASVYPGQWPELRSDRDEGLKIPTREEIEERARVYKEQHRYADRFAFIQAKDDLEAERQAQEVIQDDTLRKDHLDRLRKRNTLRKKAWRNIQQVEQLIASLSAESHLKV